LLRYSFKDYYGGPNITKDFRVLLLKITVDFPKSLQNPLDVDNWKWTGSWIEASVAAKSLECIHTRLLF